MCIARNLSSDDSTQLFGMNTDSSGSYPHLYSTSKILNFINGTEVIRSPSAAPLSFINQSEVIRSTSASSMGQG